MGAERDADTTAADACAIWGTETRPRAWRFARVDRLLGEFPRERPCLRRSDAHKRQQQWRDALFMKPLFPHVICLMRQQNES